MLILASGFSGAFKDSYFYSTNYLALMKFGINFFVGSIMFMTISQWNTKKYKITLAIVSILCMYYLSENKADIDTVGRMALSVLTIVIGVSFSISFASGKFDISYGVYIWGWPIQAMIVSLTTLSFWPSLIISLFITCVIAMISRVTVEEYFLRKKPLIIDMKINEISIISFI
ncbi:hypothetical protein B4907_11430 [Yersinia kristensenii]|nr:hypothetical protein B4907_11430 [Yersinia kristensenii]